ncbi:hypothetical protein cypCar_00039322 [Cyprinus carpio]|nr:hypothetical protein cypCar_00039322 [Cyprinus carpio]
MTEKGTTCKMHREDGKGADDVYENTDVITGQSGKEITDCNAMRIQPSEHTGFCKENILWISNLDWSD